jgi:hypothetical protein
MGIRRWGGVGVIVVLAACKGDSPGPTTAGGAVVAGIDGVACVGAIDEAPAGAVREEDPAIVQALLDQALGATDKGNLCAGQVFRATAPITVHRVWNSEKEYTQLGTWWTFTAPAGTREAYQKDYIICDGWSRLDRVVACKIKVGANFVVGPGQSVHCDAGASHVKSAKNQVFIANDGQNKVIHVDDCEPVRPWP